MLLLYGTHNPAKLALMRRWLASLPLTLRGLMELTPPPRIADETGKTPPENARLKAVAYRDATGMTTLSADTGLYLDGVPDRAQPGAFARRLHGREMNDDEMQAHYAALARANGGRIGARYRNALCIATADGHLFERYDETTASPPFWIVEVPHARRTKGFPLDALSVDIQTGQYYHDLPGGTIGGDEQRTGYVAFVAKSLGLLPRGGPA